VRTIAILGSNNKKQHLRALVFAGQGRGGRQVRVGSIWLMVQKVEDAGQMINWGSKEVVSENECQGLLECEGEALKDQQILERLGRIK
jgi:hypothetical protein